MGDWYEWWSTKGASYYHFNGRRAAMGGLAGVEDPYDELSVSMGKWLFDVTGGDANLLTGEMIRDMILAHRDEYLRIWGEVYGGDKEAFRPVIRSLNGR